MNQHVLVNDATQFVVNVLVGQIELPGFSCLPRTAENRHVTVGWSYIDGSFVDTRLTYNPARRWERTAESEA